MITILLLRRLLFLKLCPRVVKLSEDQFGDVLVLGSHLFVWVYSEARLAVHLLDVAVCHQL